MDALIFEAPDGAWEALDPVDFLYISVTSQMTALEEAQVKLTLGAVE